MITYKSALLRLKLLGLNHEQIMALKPHQFFFQSQRLNQEELVRYLSIFAEMWCGIRKTNKFQEFDWNEVRSDWK